MKTPNIEQPASKAEESQNQRRSTETPLQSDTKPQFPREVAMEAALRIVGRLHPRGMTQWVIAGSIRRGKATVGDIEILYIPRTERGYDPKGNDMYADAPTVNVMDKELEALIADGTLTKRLKMDGSLVGWGEKNKFAVDVATGIPVDFFATTAENWWVSLVVRTGGKETNLMLTTAANRLNRTLNAYGAGVTDRKTGEVLVAHSEEEVFELCGLEWINPEERK